MFGVLGSCACRFYFFCWGGLGLQGLGLEGPGVQLWRGLMGFQGGRLLECAVLRVLGVGEFGCWGWDVPPYTYYTARIRGGGTSLVGLSGFF